MQFLNCNANAKVKMHFKKGPETGMIAKHRKDEKALKRSTPKQDSATRTCKPSSMLGGLSSVLATKGLKRAVKQLMIMKNGPVEA